MPNLETKFVAADTLISIEKPQQLTLMNQDEKLQKAIKEKEAEIHTVRDKHFRARTPDTKEKYRLMDAQLRDELAVLLEKDGFPKDETRKLAQWNPYDQNKFAEFFDPMWMFEIDKGFDIIIGNPPYVQMQKNAGKLAKELQKFNYITFEKTGDLYTIFYEKGINILRAGGLETFITSSQWMKAAYGKSLRKYFLTKNPLKLVLLGPGAFESATVDTNILVIQNSENKKQLTGTTITELKQLNEPAGLQLEAMHYVNEETWAISDLSKQAINTTILKRGKALKNWRIRIYRGVLTGFNEAFIIEEDKRNELIKADASSKEIIRPVLRGREIEKYYTEWDGGYLINTHNGIKSQSTPAVSIKKYPTIKKYLDQFYENLESRLDQGNTPYNLRNCAYLPEFKKEKLIWKRIGSRLRFSYSAKEIYCLDSTCIATGEKMKYLTCLLNSKLCNYQLFENAPKTGMGDLIISVQALEPLLVYYPNDKEEAVFNQLLDFILIQKKDGEDFYEIENVINGLVYELYFGEEMKKSGVDILELVEKDLEAVKELPTEKAITTLYEKWQEPKNEVRNRLLLMATCCPNTIGVIEASIK